MKPKTDIQNIASQQNNILQNAYAAKTNAVYHILREHRTAFNTATKCSQTTCIQKRELQQRNKPQNTYETENNQHSVLQTTFKKAPRQHIIPRTTFNATMQLSVPQTTYKTAPRQRIVPRTTFNATRMRRSIPQTTY